MSDPQDPGPAVHGEDDTDRDDEHLDGEDPDEAIREGIARDNQLEHAIDEDEG